MRQLICTVFLGICFLMPATSFADDSIELVQFKGKKSAAIQKSIRNVLLSNGFLVSLVDARGETADAVATVTATIGKEKQKWVLRIQIWSGDTDTPAKEIRLKARKAKALPGLVKRNFWKRSKEVIAVAASDQNDSAEPTDNPSEDEEDQDEAPADTDTTVDDSSDTPTISATSVSTKRSTRPLSISLGPKIVRRKFSYNDDIFNSLASYDVSGMAALAAEASYDINDSIGIAGNYVFTPEFNSALDGSSDIPFPTTSMSFAAGARYHIALSGVTVHLAGDYGGHNFTIKSPQRPEIPNVRFRYLRAGVGGSMELTPRIGVHIEGGYRHLLSTGEIETTKYFPKLDAAAVDSRLALRVAIMSGVQVELAGTLERFFFSMNPSPGDQMIAGGATDQYLGGQLSLRYSPSL